MAQILIQRKGDGATLEIARADFAKGTIRNDRNEIVTFEEAGLKVVSYADGSPIEQPKAADGDPKAKK